MCDQKTNLKRHCGKALIGAVALLAVVLTGCKHHNAINFVTNTQFGAKIGVNAEKIPEIQVGYNRQEAARVPVYLMTSDDKLSASPPTIASLLNQASERLEEAKPPADWEKAGADAVRRAQRLVQTAASFDKSKEHPQGRSVLLSTIEAETLKLSTNPKKTETPQNLSSVQDLIRAEVGKPKLFAEFHKDAKFIGTRNGTEFNDAYSVIGTFSGGGTATSTSTGTTSGPQAYVKGRIAQYFATGIAAQLLAEKGGAALVNSAAPPASSGVDPKLVQQQAEMAIKNAETVADSVLKGANEAERKSRLETVMKGVPVGGPDADQATRDKYLTALAKIDKQAKLRDKLVNTYSDYLAQMVKQLPD